MAVIEAIGIPDTHLCKQVTELVRDTEPELLFNHSSRVYYFGALTGLRRGLRFDRELLYVGAMFHDMGLTRQHSSQTERFEVDGANAARAFLKAHDIAQSEIDLVWTAIALHTTPCIPSAWSDCRTATFATARATLRRCRGRCRRSRAAAR